MSPNSLSPEKWLKLYEKLCAVFNTYSTNQSAQAAFYLTELSNCKSSAVEKAIDHIVRTHDRFPSIAQLLETIRQLDPPPDPAAEQAKRESEDWQKAEYERKRVLYAINTLPDDLFAELINEARTDCAKFENWPAYSIILDARKIMLYRQKYTEL